MSTTQPVIGGAHVGHQFDIVVLRAGHDGADVGLAHRLDHKTVGADDGKAQALAHGADGGVHLDKLARRHVHDVEGATVDRQVALDRGLRGPRRKEDALDGGRRWGCRGGRKRRGSGRRWTRRRRRRGCSSRSWRSSQCRGRRGSRRSGRRDLVQERCQVRVVPGKGEDPVVIQGNGRQVTMRAA